MTKTTTNEGRRAWSKPELRRIEAGSAEGGGGTKGDGKVSDRS